MKNKGRNILTDFLPDIVMKGAPVPLAPLRCVHTDYKVVM
jgi:hypothetical protein